MRTHNALFGGYAIKDPKVITLTCDGLACLQGSTSAIAPLKSCVTICDAHMDDKPVEVKLPATCGI